jgi:hypothetical protein
VPEAIARNSCVLARLAGSDFYGHLKIGAMIGRARLVDRNSESFDLRSHIGGKLGRLQSECRRALLRN